MFTVYLYIVTSFLLSIPVSSYIQFAPSHFCRERIRKSSHSSIKRSSEFYMHFIRGSRVIPMDICHWLRACPKPLPTSTTISEFVVGRCRKATEKSHCFKLSGLWLYGLHLFSAAAMCRTRALHIGTAVRVLWLLGAQNGNSTLHVVNIIKWCPNYNVFIISTVKHDQHQNTKIRWERNGERARETEREK